MEHAEPAGWTATIAWNQFQRPCHNHNGSRLSFNNALVHDSSWWTDLALVWKITGVREVVVEDSQFSCVIFHSRHANLLPQHHPQLSEYTRRRQSQQHPLASMCSLGSKKCLCSLQVPAAGVRVADFNPGASVAVAFSAEPAISLPTLMLPAFKCVGRRLYQCVSLDPSQAHLRLPTCRHGFNTHWSLHCLSLSFWHAG